MKYLQLLRHAKSDWGDDSQPDFERALAPRGEKDAPRIGKALCKKEPQPDYILCSTARRARQTVEMVAKAAHLKVTPEFTQDLYAASADEVLHLVRGLPAASKCALLVGHNPGFSEAVGRLIGSEIEEMPTAALACIALEGKDWSDIREGAGRLEWLLTPKSLKDDG